MLQNCYYMRITTFETPIASKRTSWEIVTKQLSYPSSSSCKMELWSCDFYVCSYFKRILSVASVFIPLKVLFAAPYYYGSDVDLLIFANRKYLQFCLITETRFSLGVYHLIRLILQNPATHCRVVFFVWKRLETHQFQEVLRYQRSTYTFKETM